MLHKISYTDKERTIRIEAYCENYCYDSSTNSLHFLSIGGHPGAVKAILSSLISNHHHSVEIDTGGEEKLNLSAPNWRKLRTMTHKLSSGAMHGILIAGGGEDDSSLLILDATPQRIFKLLFDTFPLTALESWADFIAGQMEAEGYLRYLQGNMKAALLDIKEPGLDEIVSQGVKQNRISLTGGTANKTGGQA